MAVATLPTVIGFPTRLNLLPQRINAIAAWSTSRFRLRIISSLRSARARSISTKLSRHRFWISTSEVPFRRSDWKAIAYIGEISLCKLYSGAGVAFQMMRRKKLLCPCSDFVRGEIVSQQPWDRYAIGLLHPGCSPPAAIIAIRACSHLTLEQIEKSLAGGLSR